MRKTILAMTVLAAFACTAQTSNPTSPTTPPDQTQSSPSTTTPSTTPTPDMQQTPSTTPAPEPQQTTPSTTAPEPSSQSTTPSAVPQSDQPSTATPDASSPTATPSQAASTASSAATGQSYEGCIREKHGKYMLMTMDGQKYMLNSSQDLSAHKGHEVKITGDLGTSAAASAMTESNEKGETAAQEKAEHMKGNMQTLNVTNLDMVSTSCKMGHMKKGDMDHDSGMSNPK